MKKIVIILIFMLALNIHNVNAIESPFFISDVVIGGRTEDDYPDNGFSDTEIDEVSGDSEESDVSNYRDCPIFIDNSTDPPQPNDLYYMVQDLFNLIKFGTPALVIVLSLIDYLSAIAKSNDDEVKKANKRTIKRVAVGLVIFFLPFLLYKLFEIFGLVDASRCGIGT